LLLPNFAGKGRGESEKARVHVGAEQYIWKEEHEKDGKKIFCREKGGEVTLKNSVWQKKRGGEREDEEKSR